jgi:FkbM family methyltransferase
MSMRGTFEHKRKTGPVKRAVKKTLKAIFRRVVMPIMRGTLKGKKWHVTTPLRFFGGTYEPEQTAIVEEMLMEGDIVLDLGAHVGYYTVLASVLVGDTGEVIAFEPEPENLYLLHDHIKLNKCNNVTVIEACVADCAGECSFQRGGTGSGHMIDEGGDFTVPVVSLDQLLAEGTIPLPDYMKIDVEGAEMRVLHGARQVIAEARPTIFLSVHSDQLRDECSDFLKAHDYQLRAIAIRESSEPPEILAVPVN